MTEAAPYAFAFPPGAVPQKAREFADAGWARLEPALSKADAMNLNAHLAQDLVWNTTFRRSDRDWDVGPEQMAALGEQRVAEMARSETTDDLKYLFEIARTPVDRDEQRQRGLALDHLALAWGAPGAMAVWNALLGRDDVTGISLMASRYRPGHFLTAHDDAKVECRVAALVLSLTPGWRVEWGGLLHFHGPDDTIEDTLVPRFNTLALFPVPRVHSVSMVTPLAPGPRLSITGWLLREV